MIYMCVYRYKKNSRNQCARTQISARERVSNWKFEQIHIPRTPFNTRVPICTSFGTHRHLARCARPHQLSGGVSSLRFSPRDDTNWMIQYRGNVIGNEIGRPSRFVTCNFSTRVPSRPDNEEKKIAAASPARRLRRRNIFISPANDVQLREITADSPSLFSRSNTYTHTYTHTHRWSPFSHFQKRSPAPRIIISMNGREGGGGEGCAFILISGIQNSYSRVSRGSSFRSVGFKKRDSACARAREARKGEKMEFSGVNS